MQRRNFKELYAQTLPCFLTLCWSEWSCQGVNKSRIWLCIIYFLKDFRLTSVFKKQPTTNLAPQPTNTEQDNHKSLQTRESHRFRKDQFLSNRYRKEEQGSPDLSSALIGSKTRSCKKRGLRSDMIICSLSSFPCESWNVSFSLQCCRQRDKFQTKVTDSKTESQTIKETVGLIRWLGATKHRFVFLVKWVVMNKGSWFSISRGSVLCQTPS